MTHRLLRRCVPRRCGAEAVGTAANPAVTVARMFSDTFAGIAPSSVAMFVVAHELGAAAGLALIRLLFPHPPAFPIGPAGPLTRNGIA